MEHEVFVPVTAERLREVLDDPARVARAVPGLQHDRPQQDVPQQDAGADSVAGRLKVRIGSHSITYRGAVRVSGQDDGSYAVEGDASEARGTGSVKLALRLRLEDAEGGCTLVFGGTASADGRVTELPAEAVGAAVLRLLNRFGENLGAAAEQEQEPPETADYLATQDFEPQATADFETTPDADDAPAPAQPPADEPRTPGGARPAAPGEASGPSAAGDDNQAPAPADSRPPASADEPRTPGGARPAAPGEASRPSAAGDDNQAPAPAETQPPASADEIGPAAPTDDTSSPAAAESSEVPPPSPEPAREEEGAAAAEDVEQPSPGDQVAEAAHARRTMIGRSAEEVDHAPPRGRYAPVPAPQTVVSPTPLRWVAPAAALALASAVVAVRALRRRR